VGAFRVAEAGSGSAAAFPYPINRRAARPRSVSSPVSDRVWSPRALNAGTSTCLPCQPASEADEGAGSSERALDIW